MDYSEQMDEIIKGLEYANNHRKFFCQYYQRGTTSCMATKNNDCDECRFFTTTINKKIEIIVREIQGLRLENEQLTKKVSKYEKLLDYARTL